RRTRDDPRRPRARRRVSRPAARGDRDMSARLHCAGLTGGWGSLTAFRDVDLAVDAGTMHAVLGPNGSGKTTLLLTLAGLLPEQGGEVAIDGVPLRSGRPTAASRAGVVLVPD